MRPSVTHRLLEAFGVKEYSGTWNLFGLPYHNFGAYVCTTKLLTAFGIGYVGFLSKVAHT